MLKHLLALIFAVALMRPCLAQQVDFLAIAPDASKNLPDAPEPQRPASRQALYFGRSIAAELPAPSDRTEFLSLEGAHARLRLISKVSSKLPSGSAFQARLEEPIAIKGQIRLAEGTLFEGHLQTVHARRMMRPGSLFMVFDHVVLPNGGAASLSVDVASVDSDAVRRDAEGNLHPTVSKKRLLIQAGGAFLTGKLADDLAETIGGTAVGVGTARYVGLATSASFLMLQKGRDVILRPGDKVEVEFARRGASLALESKR